MMNKPTEKTYAVLASLLVAIVNCQKSNNIEWEKRHRQRVRDLVGATAPSGFGIDCGTKILLADSNPHRLVFFVEYHHMNEGGMYDGWTEHKIIVTPSLAFGFNLRVTGQNRNEIKDYLADVYDSWLREEAE